MNCIESACVRWVPSMVLSLSILGTSTSTLAGTPGAVPACNNVKAGKGDFIEVVNSDLTPVRGSTLDIGEIDFTKTRSIHGAWFVVSSPKVSVQTGLGGEEFRAALEPEGRTCAQARITPLSLEFDGSSLRPGGFEEPLSIFREDEGKPRLEARVQKVTGNVRRVWMEAKAEAVSTGESNYRVHLINEGSVPAGTIHLISPDDQ